MERFGLWPTRCRSAYPGSASLAVIHSGVMPDFTGGLPSRAARRFYAGTIPVLTFRLVAASAGDAPHDFASPAGANASRAADGFRFRPTHFKISGTPQWSPSPASRVGHGLASTRRDS